MKKRIMIIAETCMDGVGKHVSDLVRHIDKSKYTLVVVHGSKRMDYYFDAMKKDMGDRVIFEAVPSMNRNIHPVDDLKALLQINGLMNHYKPQIVHCHSSKAGALGRFLGLRKTYVEKIFYTPHAYSIQNATLIGWKHALYLYIERKLSDRKKVTTINVSKGERHFAMENDIFGKLGHSEVIYNAIEDKENKVDNKRSFIHHSLKIPEEATIVICVARLQKQKNPYLFIEIAGQMTNQYKDIHFVWVGEGELAQEVKKKVSTYNQSLAEDQIHFIGHRTDVHELLCASEMFLSTALYEGLPYTLVEACRAGLPMIASDITGNNEVVVDQVNGLLFPLEPSKGKDRQSATEAIITLVEDEKKRQLMGQEARRIYENQFGLKHMLNAIESLYDD